MDFGDALPALNSLLPFPLPSPPPASNGQHPWPCPEACLWATEASLPTYRDLQVSKPLLSIPTEGPCGQWWAVGMKAQLTCLQMGQTLMCNWTFRTPHRMILPQITCPHCLCPPASPSQTGLSHFLSLINHESLNSPREPNLRHHSVGLLWRLNDMIHWFMKSA